MKTLMKLTLIGYTGNTPEIKNEGTPNEYLKFPVAVRERIKGNEETKWFQVLVFNQKITEFLKQYLNKGNPVYIEGIPNFGYEVPGVIAQQVINLGHTNKNQNQKDEVPF